MAGGVVVLRTQLADAMPDLWQYRWAPRMREVDTAMYEPLPSLRSSFEHALEADPVAAREPVVEGGTLLGWRR